MIKCPNCGFDNDDNCTFCAICGSYVTQDDFYVHNTASTAFSVEELTKKLISKDKQENAKTKSFKKLDKATLAKEAAKIENEKVKEYKKSSENKSEKNTNNLKANTPENSSTNNNKTDAAANKDNIAKATEKEIVNKIITETEKSNIDTSAKPKSKSENTVNISNTDAEKITTVKSDISDNKNEVKEYKPADTKGNVVEDNFEKSKIAKSDYNPKQNQAYSQSIPNSKLYNILSKFFFDTKDETNLFKQNDIDENCNLAMISYIPFLFFIPMIIKPCSSYLRYHGIQGLTMFLSFILLEFFDVILSAICNSIFNDMVGMILTVIITLTINIAVLLLISIGIANAVKGNARELPIIGKYKFLKPYIY